ncbi:hypothetical protein PVL30_005162 [Lodderomyces elongisporus]|uniref:uncharacterized protein n=1 Tax=Lodderomyces elongisporus TaxID=36914 RepID=UPI00291DEC97|nr:uncharacterized protein PVL30_005162 [Lodderomyces elongisporus]WLF81365.1 hypothetical protein PVL30_005162 [Lodderomyces elongisporus]
MMSKSTLNDSYDREEGEWSTDYIAHTTEDARESAEYSRIAISAKEEEEKEQQQQQQDQQLKKEKGGEKEKEEEKVEKDSLGLLISRPTHLERDGTSDTNSNISDDLQNFSDDSANSPTSPFGNQQYSPFISDYSSPAPDDCDLGTIDNNELNILDENVKRISNVNLEESKSPLSKAQNLKNISPWRQFRTTNTKLQPLNHNSISNVPDLKPTSADSVGSTKTTQTTETNGTTVTAGTFGTFATFGTTGTRSREDELTKQIVNYKIQIKLLKASIKELLLKNNWNPDDFRHYLSMICQDSTQLNKRLKSLQSEYDEIYNLNQDLYANLEKVQDLQKVGDLEMKSLKVILQTVQDMVATIVEIIHEGEKELKIEKIDEKTEDEKLHCDLSVIFTLPIEQQLEYIIDSLRRRRLLDITCISPPESEVETATIAPDDEDDKNNGEKGSSDDLDGDDHCGGKNDYIDGIRELEIELENRSNMCSQLQIQLNDKIKEAEEYERNLELAKATISQKVSEYETRLEELEHKLYEEGQSKQTNNGIVIDRGDVEEQEEALKQGKENHDLQIAYNEKIKELAQERQAHERIQRDLQSQLDDLNAKLKAKTLSPHSQLNTISKFERQVIGDFDINNEGEPDLRRRQISLENDSLQRENQSLRNQIDKLSQIISHNNRNNSYSDHSEKSMELHSQSILKKLSIMEYQYRDLLSFDMIEFQKFIQSYNKIAEDQSLSDPREKYEKVMKRIKHFDEEDIAFIRDKHKSIFEYFVRATDLLINDHVRLLIKDGSNEERMRKKMNLVNTENAQLRARVNQLEESYQYHKKPVSSITELRIEDLQRKWKAERERRILEDHEAQKRFRELENEIVLLKERAGT